MPLWIRSSRETGFHRKGVDELAQAVEMRHLTATPTGMRVTARCTLVEIDRRRLVFQAEVHDELDKVGEGVNERFIVDRDKHERRIEEKLARWKSPA